MEIKEKSEAEAETQFPYVPEEIVVGILSKLPFSSLLRLRSVSESWRSLIPNPRLNLSTQSPQVIILSEWYQQQHDQPWRRISSLQWVDEEAISAIEIPKPSNISNGVLRIRGSCHGLLLLSVGTDLFLWNPLTGCCKKALTYRAWRDKFLYFKSGLCYDSSTDDYKVLMLFVYRGMQNAVVAMVGSIRNKSWRKIHFPFDEVEPGPVVNEHLHWLVPKVYFRKMDTIIYFDPITDGFVQVPVPNKTLIPENRISVLGLGVMEGCLSVVLWVQGESHVEVLAMKKYGDWASWTRLFFLSNLIGLSPSHRLVPLCFTKDGKVLIQWEARRILVYDPKHDSFSDFPMRADASYVKATVFVDSLASPASYCCERGRVQGKLVPGVANKLVPSNLFPVNNPNRKIRQGKSTKQLQTEENSSPHKFKEETRL